MVHTSNSFWFSTLFLVLFVVYSVVIVVYYQTSRFCWSFGLVSWLLKKIIQFFLYLRSFSPLNYDFYIYWLCHNSYWFGRVYYRHINNHVSNLDICEYRFRRFIVFILDVYIYLITAEYKIILWFLNYRCLRYVHDLVFWFFLQSVCGLYILRFYFDQPRVELFYILA